MTLSSHVFKRGGVYHFRVRVPQALALVIGRRELTRSLRTPQSETALNRGARLAALTNDLWRALSGGMSPIEAKRLVDQWLLAKLEEDADIRDLPPGDEHFAAVFERTEPWLPDRLVRTLSRTELAEILQRDPSEIDNTRVYATKHISDADVVKLGFRKPIENAHERLVFDEDVVARPTVRGVFREAGVVVDEESVGFKAAVRLMLRAQRDLYLACVARDEAMWRPWSSDDPAEALHSRPLRLTSEPSAPVSPDPAAPPAEPPVAGRMTGTAIEDAAEAYIAESLMGGVFKPGRGDEVRTAVRIFRGWADAEVTLESVTSAMAGEYRKDMVFYPENASKRPEYRDLPIGERIRKARARNEPRRISSVTINGNYINPLRGLWDWAVSAGKVAINPFVGIRVKAAKKGATSSRGTPPDFTVDQLQKLFAAPLFTGSAGDDDRPLYEPGTHRVDDWRYWLPFVALPAITDTAAFEAELEALSVLIGDGDAELIGAHFADDVAVEIDHLDATDAADHDGEQDAFLDDLFRSPAGPRGEN